MSSYIVKQILQKLIQLINFLMFVFFSKFSANLFLRQHDCHSKRASKLRLANLYTSVQANGHVEMNRSIIHGKL